MVALGERPTRKDRLQRSKEVGAYLAEGTIEYYGSTPDVVEGEAFLFRRDTPANSRNLRQMRWVFERETRAEKSIPIFVGQTRKAMVGQLNTFLLMPEGVQKAVQDHLKARKK